MAHRTAVLKALSYQQRQDLPDSAYAYTDPQGGEHLPVHDLAHLRNAIARLGQPETLKAFLSEKAKKALQAKLQKRLASAQHTAAEIVRDLAIFNLGPDPDNESMVKDATDSDVVLRRGLIFRAGVYQDKDFSLTTKELRRIAKDFSDPIAIDSEHERSIFDGKLGKLVSVEASKDGSELHGLVAVPKWLDPILMQAGGKVSAAFDRITKKLVGLALTINPRVSDAALMAAFSVDQAAHGDVSVKEVIELADDSDVEMAKKAATPPPDSAVDDDSDDDDGDDDASSEPDDDADDSDGKAAPAKKGKKNFVGYDDMVPEARDQDQPSTRNAAAQMAMTGSGRGMMQAVHDVTASRGAICRAEPQPGTTISQHGIVRYASHAEMSVIQTIHDTTLQNGASCVSTLYGQHEVPGGSPWTWEYPGTTTEGRSNMPGSTKAPHFTEDADTETGSDKAMKAFAKFMDSMEEVDPRYGAPAVEARATPDTSAEVRMAREENAKLREENRQMRMQGILDRAVAFAEKMVMEGHATPIEREGIVTVHAQLEHDDTFSTTATFSNGMSRVAAYEASLLARPNNLLAAEMLPSAVQAGLIRFANMSETPKQTSGEYGKMSEDRMRHLTSMDPVLKKAYTDTHTNGRN